MARTGPVAMEARQVDGLPDGKGWQYEPKWDGFRCLACRDGEEIDLLGRSGKSLSFEALQMRLHPAAAFGASPKRHRR
ncbi:MAG: hypothetical protein EPO41_23065 [Reyranella sp.]|uniref:hypothetical protein n=1 Tax=Reyranella sp. TaxID=1929291 RepID=UPI001215201C|nr:hypothetical protein [Reyranella sp.]TAJ87224.1 MAG: hypothetical protein EPO41_23065 [Reyranella sp.]